MFLLSVLLPICCSFLLLRWSEFCCPCYCYACLALIIIFIASVVAVTACVVVIVIWLSTVLCSDSYSSGFVTVSLVVPKPGLSV